ncbi:hypothetical protein [Brevundimonas sp. Root1423]|uniref:hypothetical protein n=1 Tax=Brevundimonas sp. Root1423 TaxID=1736462 RepID=UPI0006FAC342|nr:hypothetical protein [Brevundimonas sp. Root1423]KQY89864.1 hypothetical protein ASD25_04885 [Brevundimonas sp. Root1423]
MRRAVRLLIASLCLSASSQSVHGQDAGAAPTRDVREIVQRLAFDPGTFFPSPHIKDHAVVRIAYTGDDYAWPVYAIAVAEGCVDGENIPRDHCASRLRARMVRAPAVDAPSSPRHRGSRLIARLMEDGSTSPAQIQASLQGMGVEWVEADLRDCPGAVQALARSADATWVPEAIANPRPGDELSGMVLHADIVQVEFKQYARLASYQGWIAEGSPAAWAVEFASALEPCWRPASVQAPWLRQTLP